MGVAGIFAHWIFHPLHGLGYQFWSGVGSDLSEITLPVALIAWTLHRTCEQPGCWRLGHPHPDHGRPVCRRHYHCNMTPERTR